MSAGITPPGDISIPEDIPHTTKTLPPPRRLVTLRQFNTLTVAIVLSANGLVCVQHLAFIVFSILYVYFLSRAIFPWTSPTPLPAVYGHNNKILTIYFTVGAVIGLFLPILYILHGFSSGSTTEQVTDVIDGSGLTAIVTGASSRIGSETAQVLALRGVSVVMGVCNMGKEVREAIVNEIPNAKLTPWSWI